MVERRPNTAPVSRDSVLERLKNSPRAREAAKITVGVSVFGMVAALFAAEALAIPSITMFLISGSVYSALPTQK